MHSGSFRRHKYRQTGFTLVELLVVIAIIGVLIALLLPAVQAAREAARRSQCTNNLKQIGLALHNHHDTNRKFPPGYDYVNNASYNNLPSWGWAVHILPFMEEQNLHTQLNPGKRLLKDVYVASTTPPSADQIALQTTVPGYRCPSDTTKPLNDKAFFTGNFYDLATNNYKACAGNVNNHSAADIKGMFWGNSQLTMASATDGTSKVLAVGETSIVQESGIWAGAGRTNDGNWGVRLGTGRSNFAWNFNYDVAGQDPNNRFKGFGSLHTGGLNMLMLDGSVHFMSQNATDAVRTNLGIRDDGNVIELP